MKRGWFGLVLLVILLAGGGLSAWTLSHRQEPLERALTEASQCALVNNWQEALALTHQVSQVWNHHWHITAAFSDHAPMEEIDGMLAQLEIYGEKKDNLSFAVLCAELSREMAAIGDAHLPTWWNLL